MEKTYWHNIATTSSGEEVRKCNAHVPDLPRVEAPEEKNDTLCEFLVIFGVLRTLRQ